MVNTRKVQGEPVWLLHQREFRETSRIVDFFSRDYGRVALFARGVRTSRSLSAALLQPFQPLVIAWQGSGDGGRLTSVESIEPPINVAPACRMAGFYMNELVLKLLTREDPHPDIFEHYSSALRSLSRVEEQARTLRLFEKRLLEALGVLPDFSQNNRTGVAVRADAVYHVRPGQGVLDEATTGLTTGPTVQTGAALLALAQEQLDDPRWAEPIRQLLAACIDLALDGNELKTRVVAHTVRAFERATKET
jgi:DNA repair protein RecO (recombination protein O)